MSDNTSITDPRVAQFFDTWSLIQELPTNILSLRLTTAQAQSILDTFIRKIVTEDEYQRLYSDTIQLENQAQDNLDYLNSNKLISPPQIITIPPETIVNDTMYILADCTSPTYSYNGIDVFDNPLYQHSLSSAYVDATGNWNFFQPLSFVVADVLNATLDPVFINNPNQLAVWTFDNIISATVSTDVSGNKTETIVYKQQDSTNLSGSWSFYDILDIKNFVAQKTNLVQNALITDAASKYKVDDIIANYAYNENQVVTSFFENVIDQQAFLSNDGKRMRRMFIDWYAANRTLITKLRNINNLNTLTNDELVDLSTSLGFPYLQFVYSRKTKVTFIQHLINFYHKKGTPEVLGEVLEAFGLVDIVISEWWIKYIKDFNDFYAVAQPVYPTARRNDQTYMLMKDYEDFIRNNPFWQITKDELDRIYRDPNTLITLPSLTSVISIQSNCNITHLNPTLAIIQRKVQEEFTFWLEYVLLNVNVTAKNKIPMVNDPPIIPLILDAPPDTLVPGDEFIVSNNPTLYTDFYGYANKLASWDGINWTFSSIPQYKYIIGSTPTGIFASPYVYNSVTYTNHSRLLATYNFNTSSWSYEQIMNGDIYIISDDSPIRPSRIAVFINPGNVINEGYWNLSIPDTNYIIKVQNPSTTHMVWNGDYWADLGIPIGAFSNPTFGYDISHNKKIGHLNKVIPLNRFTEIYSFIEVILAIAYLFDSNVTDDPNFLYYNGPVAPFDVENNMKIRNDIDDGAPARYQEAIAEFDDLVYDITKTKKEEKFRYYYSTANIVTPRKSRTLRLAKYNNWFTAPLETTSGNSGISLQRHAASFLEAINPKFKKEIDSVSEIDRIDTLESIMLDFEDYLLRDLQIIKYPFVYLILGGSFYANRLKPVIDFFKPFRVKVLEFITGIVIDNPLEDSQLVDDELKENIKEIVVDDPQYFGYDNGIVSDVHIMEIDLNEHEPKNCFDSLNNSYCDILQIDVYDL